MALEDTIESLAGKPQKGITDGLTFEMPNLKDLIAADQYLKAVAASKGRFLPIGMSQMLPQGAMPYRCSRYPEPGVCGW